MRTMLTRRIGGGGGGGGGAGRRYSILYLSGIDSTRHDTGA